MKRSTLKEQWVENNNLGISASSYLWQVFCYLHVHQEMLKDQLYKRIYEEILQLKIKKIYKFPKLHKKKVEIIKKNFYTLAELFHKNEQIYITHKKIVSFYVLYDFMSKLEKLK